MLKLKAESTKLKANRIQKTISCLAVMVACINLSAAVARWKGQHLRYLACYKQQHA